MQGLTLATSEAPAAEERCYRPRGAAKMLMTCREPEVLLSGPAGTGKTRSALEKIHLTCLKYPLTRVLLLRKTRESLTETALATFETRVVPPRSPVLAGPQRNFRQVYRYPNQSEITVGGLDKASRWMSSDYDLAYIPEATETTEADWELVTTRLRNGSLPYSQLLGDCNPDAEHHWLKQRCNRGQTLLLESYHRDNPSVTDEYLARLDKLTGVRRERLLLGRWVSAEGVVYEGWRPEFHRLDPFPIPQDWPRYWSVDFGYVHPFVWQAWAADHDGRLFRYREIYHTGRLVEDHARQILAVTEGEPRPRAIVCDHDAEDRATLERHLRLPSVPAYKSVSPGIQAVAARLREAGDEYPRLFFFRDAVVETDPALSEARKPTSTEPEFDSYVWDTGAGRKKGEAPLKEADDGLDATRYLVCFVDKISEEQPNPLAGMMVHIGVKSGWHNPGGPRGGLFG